MTDKQKLEAIKAEIERFKKESLNYGYSTEQRIIVDVGKDMCLRRISDFIDSLPEEPVSEELKEAARDTLDTYKPVFSSSTSEGEPIEYYSPGQMRTMFMKGSHWQKEHYPKELTNSDLETAADKYAIKIYNMFIKDETIFNNKEGDEILSDAFKAGANWQLNKCRKEYERKRD